MHDITTVLGLALSLGLMYVGVKVSGAGGGIIGFVVGAALAGVIASNMGIEIGDRGCERYSSHVNEC